MRAIIALFLCAAALNAQAPAFEVASIRPAEFPSDAFFRGFTSAGTCGRAQMKISGNRVTIAIASLCSLIRLAYDVQDYRITGAPGWMSKNDQSLFYQIEAKAPGDGVLKDGDASAMFRALLAERFQLKLHRETRDLPVYNLVAARTGHKLSTQPLPAVGMCGDMKAKAAALDATPGPGLIACRPTMTTAQIAEDVTRNVDRPVVDRTGLTGKYAFALRYTPEGKDLGPNAPPSIFTAVQEQLGLKLEPAKEPLEFIVIDRAERPTIN